MSPRPARRAPRELCVSWPNEVSADPVAEVARRFALSLQAALGNRSQREIARITGVDRATIGTVLAGSTWPDLATIAKLEIGLGRRLWPEINGVPQ
ncbi:helix-turn-helix domain-containing protein [Mycetocola zhujimingii]|uniref:HTH cro/C1-type domain-containing protein n=1 Tax=Mycetocola zhujimingii TaxID=2079792 RepID=A0A2U1TCE4_9MICO|nr:helix-turn-helix transcriptional regulator [Mycetocola zhujimingii]PWC06567.1 hypothetical protein DF223_10720 [Mycetocola zhujimingii]